MWTMDEPALTVFVGGRSLPLCALEVMSVLFLLYLVGWRRPGKQCGGSVEVGFFPYCCGCRRLGVAARCSCAVRPRERGADGFVWLCVTLGAAGSPGVLSMKIFVVPFPLLFDGSRLPPLGNPSLVSPSGRQAGLCP